MISFLIIFLRSRFLGLLIVGFWLPAKKVKEVVRKAEWQSYYYSSLFGIFFIIYYDVKPVEPNNNSHVRNCKMSSGHSILTYSKISSTSTMALFSVFAVCSSSKKECKSILAAPQEHQNGSILYATCKRKKKTIASFLWSTKGQNLIITSACGRWKKGKIIWVPAENRLSIRCCRMLQGSSQGYFQKSLQKPHEACEYSPESQYLTMPTEKSLLLHCLFICTESCIQLPVHLLWLQLFSTLVF